jgi:VanZ family protein
MPRVTPSDDARHQALWLWLPVIAWCALIFTLSSFSKLPAPPSGISDKHEHFVTYAILAVLLLRALVNGRWTGVTLGIALTAALATAAYGATDELHQYFVPGRDCSWGDLLADSLGALTAAGLILAYAIIRRVRPAEE